MQLVTFEAGGERRPGVLEESRILDLAIAGLPIGPDGDLRAIVAGGAETMAQLGEAVAAWKVRDYPAGTVALCAPILKPPKIIGIGLNYVDHCREAGLEQPKEPILFSKYATSVSGPNDDIVWREVAEHDR